MGIFRDLNSRLTTTITLIVLVAVTTALIVWALPRKSGPSLEFQEGKPWTSGTLIANFKFNIYKSEEAIKKERDELMKTYRPYFILDSEKEESAIEDFREAVKRDTTGILKKYKESIERRLRYFYNKGIMSNPDYSRYENNNETIINVIKDDNIVDPLEISSIMSEGATYSSMLYDEELSEHSGELSQFNLNNYVRANLIYDTERNASAISDLENSIAPIVGTVEKNEKIIDRGEVVNELAASKINSLRYEYEKRYHGKSDNKHLIIGQTIFVLLFVVLYTIYLLLFRIKYFDKLRNILMLYFMIIIFPMAVSFMMRDLTLIIYIIPFAIVPMITRVFLDSRTAFMTHVTTVLIAAVAVNYQYEFIIIEMAGGMAAIFALSDMSKRAHLFKAAIMASLCSGLVYYAIQLIQGSELIPQDKNIYAYITINGVLLLLAYPLMYIIEKLFGYVSNITFFELSDTNQELLRMLSEKAPGTFAHSTTVGNLAAEIAKRIGANMLLVRTGALYHDIGKMENPVFFTENQAGVNPHVKLSEKESARIIIRHVTEGQRLAEKYNLPDMIKDFILTHHGKGMTSFFYVKYKNAHPDEDVDTDLFSYPGPNPQTREQAILMMADTVEAATKSLDVYDDEIISKKVNELIDRQVKEGYFEECPITFRDIAVAKQVLIERLKSIYHTRIKYPELNSQ